MNDVEFYKTRCGRMFYEKTMPELVKQLEEIAREMAELSARIEAWSKKDDE